MTQLKQTIGFIGFGNMAQAIAKGLLAQKVVSPQQIYACAAHYDALEKRCAPLGIHACENAAALCQTADVIILAVKPALLEEAMEGTLELLDGKMIVCLAAGKPFAAVESLLPGTHHISIMPNTPISTGQGIVIAETENSLTEVQKEIFTALFSPIALIEDASPAQFSIAGTIAGCTPAFAAMFIEALADAGVRYGLTRSMAYALSAKALEGTGALYFAQDGNPASMKDAVCSPGGTTIKGVCALEKNGFRHAVISAIEAIEQKH